MQEEIKERLQRSRWLLAACEFPLQLSRWHFPSCEGCVAASPEKVVAAATGRQAGVCPPSVPALAYSDAPKQPPYALFLPQQGALAS